MFYKTLSLSAIVVALLGVEATVDKQDATHSDHVLKCAQLCAECQVQCDMCFNHCATLVKAGDRDHARSMQYCLDCADCCKLCSSLVARQSPFANGMAEFCAKCCEECATSCSQFVDDKEMMGCADLCRKCAKSCREMMKM